LREKIGSLTYWITVKGKKFCTFVRKNLHISEKKQPTFNEVFDMACMLPHQEQQMLLDKVAGRLYVEQLARLQERKAHIEESERQIAAGMVYSEEESDAMMDQIVDQLSISIAA
jgi:hypothetical protein